MIPSTKSSPNENPAFVPSPRWLSESPARPGLPLHVDSVAGHTTVSQRCLYPSQNSWSPALSAPANLHQESANAFNLDPGIPRTADSGSSDGGSIKQESLRENRIVGGVVTGITKALRNSLRDRMKSRQGEPSLPMYAHSSKFQDSGYADSISQDSQRNPPPPQVDEEFLSRSSSVTSYGSVAYPPSETLLGHPSLDPKLYDENNITGPQQIFSPEAMDSPISAEPEYGSDYVGMGPTAPESLASLKTYIRRVSKLIHDISTLPWVATERVTVDYYPEDSKRCDEPPRHPALAWCSQNDSFYDSQSHSGTLKIDGSVSSEMQTSDGDLISPHHRIFFEGMDLSGELTERYYNQAEQQLVYESPHPDSQNRNQSPLGNNFRSFGTPSTSHESPWLDSGPYPQDEAGTNSIPQSMISHHQPFYSPRHLSRPTSQRIDHSPMQHQASPPSISSFPSPSPSKGGEWQEYPHEMGGYVPYEFAEHYYGDKYGPGVHATRPPLPDAPSPPISSRTASHLQQQHVDVYSPESTRQIFS